MSSSPRSRSSQTAIFALAVGAALIGVILILLYYGVNVLQAGQEVLDRPVPADRGDDAGRRDPEPVHRSSS